MNRSCLLPCPRLSLLAAVFSLGLSAAAGPVHAQAPDQQASVNEATVEDLAQQARAIHERVLTLDSHVDIPLNFASPAHDPLNAEAQVNLEKMREGGLDAAFFIVYTGQGERNEQGYARARQEAMTKFDAIARMLETYSDQIGLATTAQQARNLHEEGRLAAFIGVENGFALGQSLALLEDFYRRGARYMTLVHNGHNDLADSAQAQPGLGDEAEEHGGLSELGRQAVAQMNDLGMLVDVSHASRRTMLEVTEVSRAPVIASHSAIQAITPHPRNLDDEQLMALRDSGGVVQVVAFDSYLKEVPREKREAVEALQQELGMTPSMNPARLSSEDQLAYAAGLAEINQRWPGATVQDLVDHIAYAIDLIGIDHVGISSDFGGGGGVQGWQDAQQSLNVTLELVSRGYSEAEIAQLWSGNLLRVLEQAAQLAGQAN